MGRGKLKGFRRPEEAISIVFPAGGHHERQQLAPKDIARRSYQATVPTTTTKIRITRLTCRRDGMRKSCLLGLLDPSATVTQRHERLAGRGRTRHDLPTECLTADYSPAQIFLERKNIMLNRIKRVSTYPRRLWWDLDAENTPYVFCISTCRV